MDVSMFHLMPNRDLPEDFEEEYDSVWIDPPFDEVADASAYGDYYNWMIEEMLYAAELGLDGICTNEHHQNAYGGMPNPNLIGTALAHRTQMEGLEETAIIQMGMTLPAHPIPVRVAEEYAMVDCVSQGRMVAGLPIGSPMDVNQACGVDPLEQRERFYEAHEFLLRAWEEEEEFAFNGDFYQLPRVNVWPKPVQRPHPPFWVPGTGSKSTQEFVLDHDYAYCFLSFRGYENIKGSVDQFWAFADEKGVNDNPYRLGVLQMVGVAESDAKAEEMYSDHVEYFFQKTQHIPFHYLGFPGHLYYEDMMKILRKMAHGGLYEEEGEDELPLEEKSYRQHVEDGAVIAGGPETVADRLVELAKELRTGNLMVLLQIGSMGHEETKKNIQLFAEEVYPRLEEMWEEEWTNEWWPEKLREPTEPAGV